VEAGEQQSAPGPSKALRGRSPGIYSAEPRGLPKGTTSPARARSPTAVTRDRALAVRRMRRPDRLASPGLPRLS
jgi:hypothetical protein